MRQVVFVLSTNYAGSHLLSQLLGAHTACRSVGELHNLRKYARRQRRSDDVDAEFTAHPAFEGLLQLPETRWHSRIFENVQREAPWVSTLIDNSKRTRWAERFAQHDQFVSHYVHLLRDPRALVRRWLATYTTNEARRRQRIRLARMTPGFIRLALGGEDADVYRYKWLAANRRITRFTERFPGRTTLVTYRDLVVNTRSTLETLMPHLSLEFQPPQLGYGGAAMAGTRKRRYAELTKESRIELDTRWRDDLSRSQIRAIESDPAVIDYLRSLGVEMVESGLTMCETAS